MEMVMKPLIAPILIELEEMISDADVEDDIKKKSAEYAYQFLEEILLSNKNLSPDLELHPDGNASVTFRNEKGIFSIVFSDTGRASWGLYFPNDVESEGYFMLNDGIPEAIVTLIRKFI